MEKPLGCYFQNSWQAVGVQPPPPQKKWSQHPLPSPAKHEAPQFPLYQTKLFRIPPFAAFLHFSRSPLVAGVCACHEFGLHAIRWHSAARKHQFLYFQGKRSGLRKPKMKKTTLFIATNSIYLPKSVSTVLMIKSDNQPNWKGWSVRLVNTIKHLSQEKASF